MRKKKIIPIILSFTFLTLIFQFDQFHSLPPVKAEGTVTNPHETKGYPFDADINPKGFQKRQVVTKPVTAMNTGTPGVYWYQMDDGSFEADQYDGTKVYTNNIGDNGDNPLPNKKAVTGKVDSFNYKADYFFDSNTVGTDVESYPFDSITSKIKQTTKLQQGKDDKFYSNGSLSFPSDNRSVIFTVTTGGEPKSDKVPLDHIKPRPNGHVKYMINYNVPIDFVWEGTVKEIKEISLTGVNQMKIGETKNFTAAVKTKPFSEPSDTGFKAPVDITTRPEATWSSDKKAVVEVVDPHTGQVKANSKGRATITVKWESGMYTLYDNIVVSVEDGEVEEPDPGQPPGEVTCTVPQPGQSMNGKYMDPVVTAVIKADNRHNEQFDVLQGIPTSESLYGNVLARNHLFQNKFVQMTGKCIFPVSVTKEYTLKWDPGKEVTDDKGNKKTVSDPQSITEPKTYQFTIERPYAFWKIDNLEVYKINNAILQNYALPNEKITINPSGYTPPNFATTTNGNYYPPSPPSEVHAPSQTITGGKDKPSIPAGDATSLKSEAEKAVEKVKVENDSLTFNGQTIMNGQRVDETGPTPSQIPEPQQIGENVLYSPGNMISSSKVNQKDTTSSGKIMYDLMPGNINGGQKQEFPIYGINTVTVHTPVVNYSSVSDDQAHNQKTNPNYNRSALILDRPFTVRIPTSGQHVNYPGYGNRDYAKYFRTKQVRFPFDVYNKDKTQFIPKNTWIDIPVPQLDTTFFLPVWVDEGDYQVYFRSIAENAPAEFTHQPDANTDWVNHVATDEVSVEVIGRLYDFHITDIADYNWEYVFRTQIGSTNPRGISYWVGHNLIDGDPRGNRDPFTLPIHPGSNPLPGMKNVSIKTGYHFKFDFKTKGNNFGKLDGIRIKPSFYFVTKDGMNRMPVDLYYRDNNNFVKIGSEEDKVQRYVILNDRMRNVPAEELTDTASYKFNHYGMAGNQSKNQFADFYTNKFTKQKTPVGGFNLLLLPEQVRTFIGPKNNLPVSVDAERANVAIQKWYGEYSLPAAPYVVKSGVNIAEYGRMNGGLDDQSSIFLKNGYIIVNFDIESIQNGDLKNPHLQYIHAPLMNQWQMEGFSRNILDSYGNQFNLLDGDVVFYHADKSSRNDFSAQAPH